MTTTTTLETLPEASSGIDSLSIAATATTVTISNFAVNEVPKEQLVTNTELNTDLTVKSPPSTATGPPRLDMICNCGTKMQMFEAKAFIDWNNIWCSLCLKKIHPKQSLYFCSKNSRHPDGYYLCNDCAVTKRIRAQIQRGYELNCELIRSCGGKVQSGRDDDYHRGVKFPCQSPSCEICDGQYYSESNNLYFKPTPWACYGRR